MVPSGAVRDNYVQEPAQTKQLSIITSIVLIGCSNTISLLEFISNYWESAIQSLLLTVAVIIWAKAAVSSSTTITAYLKEKEDWNVIKKETETIFNLSAKLFISLTALYCLLIAWHINPESEITFKQGATKENDN